MSKRSRRPSIRRNKSPAKEELSILEWQAPVSFNLNAPSDGEKSLPLRLLDNFRFFTSAQDGKEALASLDSLVDGLVDGEHLQAEGVLLDQKLAAASTVEARSAAYAKLAIPSIQDWVVDYSDQPCIWIATSNAWYRLADPQVEYAPMWAPMLAKLQLASACFVSLQEQPYADYETAVSGISLELQARGATGSVFNKQKLRKLDAQQSPAASQQKLRQAELKDALEQHAAFLACNLSHALGRHAIKSGLLAQLADVGGIDLLKSGSQGRPGLLLYSTSPTSADPTSRPKPRTDFMAPSHMQASLLMIWDFCQSNRQLLRLPPFPLSRLEVAFSDKLESEYSKEEQESRSGVFLKDIHMSMIRILEGSDVGMLEPPTLAGYGSAAELYPKNVFRPLLSGTWPELVRQAVIAYCEQNKEDPAARANTELKAKNYWQLTAEDRLALLRALVHTTADTEVVRQHLQDTGTELMNEQLGRGLPIGVDDTGTSYFQLASDAGKQALFVEVRDEGLPEGHPGIWGYYPLSQIPSLVNWLDTGSQNEFELAENIYQAFQPQMYEDAEQEVGIQGASTSYLQGGEDGFSSVQPELAFTELLRREIGSWFTAVRFWEKHSKWLQAAEAVKAELKRAATAVEFARLLFISEDMVYVDVMKGTGWGRKRSWCKDQLESCQTMAQAGVIASQIAWHSRGAADLGIISSQEYREELSKGNKLLTHVHNVGDETIFLRSGYAAHIHQAAPPKDALAYPLPSKWGLCENITVRDVFYARGDWQRPSWQGRNIGSTAPETADDLFMACLLVERNSGESSESSPATLKAEDSQHDDKGEIDWESFSFQFGFRQNRIFLPLKQALPPTNTLEDNTKKTEASMILNQSAAILPSKKEASPLPNVGGQALPTGDSREASADAPGGLRRSGRVRTEVAMPDYDASTDASEVPHVMGTRSKRLQGLENSQAASLSAYQGAVLQPLAIPSAEVLPEDDFAIESTKFWKHDRDLAAILVYVRKAGAPSIDYLISPTKFLPSMSRSWPEGTMVKMPAFPTVTRPGALLDIKWYTGVVSSTFAPKLPASITKPEGSKEKPPVKKEIKSGAAATQEASDRSLAALPSGKQPAASAAVKIEQQQEAQPSQLQTSQPQKDAPESTQQSVDEGQKPVKERPAANEGQQMSEKTSGAAAVSGGENHSGNTKEEAAIQLGRVKADDVVANGKPEEPPQHKEKSSTSFMDLLTGKGEPDKQPAQNPGGNPVPLFTPVTGALALQASPKPTQLVPNNAIAMAYQKIAGGPLSAQSFGQGVGLARTADASAQLLQRPSAANQQGLRLSELVPQHAARGATPSFARPSVTSSGGPGGPTDPWKALCIRWDYGTPMHWPIRVSPWEILEDVGGASRIENTKMYGALLAKQSSEQAALRQIARPATSYLPQPANGQFPRPTAGAAGFQAPFTFRPSAGAQANGGVMQMYGAAQGRPYQYNPAGVAQGQPTISGFRPLVPPPQQMATSQPHALVPSSQPNASPSPAPQMQDPSRNAKRRRTEAEPEEKSGRGPTEGYRERWLAKRPRPNPNSWLSGFCSACETGGEELPLLPCMGPCLRAFHGPCVGLTAPPADAWFCPECETGKMRCFICGEYSTGFDDLSVRKCSLGVCGRFYHSSCAEAAPLAQVAKKGGHFRCPQHYCATCGKSGDGVDMVKCIRCPTAYHSMCMNALAAHRLHPHSKVILCEKHGGSAPPSYIPPPASPRENQEGGAGSDDKPVL